MLPAGFCFLELINPDKRDKARECVFLMIMIKDKARNDSLGNIIS
jgi:hypothetical protein